MSKKNIPSETSAMETVNSVLEPLEEGARIRVLQWVTQKLGIPLSTSSNPVTQPNQLITPQNKAATQVGEIKNFIAGKKPKDSYQLVACLAYYMEKFEGKSEFKTTDLIDANTRAKQTRVSNMTARVNDATQKYGFFTPTSKGNKSLTTRGEAVVDALPDQEKVRDVLKNNPYKRKSGT